MNLNWVWSKGKKIAPVFSDPTPTESWLRPKKAARRRGQKRLTEFHPVRNPCLAVIRRLKGRRWKSTLSTGKRRFSYPTARYAARRKLLEQRRALADRNFSF